MSRPAVSHHLKLLEQSGLVSVTKEGTQRIYRAETEQGLAMLETLIHTLRADLAETPSRD